MNPTRPTQRDQPKRRSARANPTSGEANADFAQPDLAASLDIVVSLSDFGSRNLEPDAESKKRLEIDRWENEGGEIGFVDQIGINEYSNRNQVIRFAIPHEP
jgi:hypothetical protein